MTVFKLAPQLAQPLDRKNVERYISDPNWWMEQKLDGHRMIVHVHDHHVTVFNRRGEEVESPQPIIKAFTNLEGAWVFDGEWLDGKFWLFDLVFALGKVLPEMSRDLRRPVLEAVYDAGWKDNPTVHLVDVAKIAKDKRALLQWCSDNNAEGVVLKLRTAPYRGGKRMGEMLKVKFTETCDCVISSVRREGKDSCGISLYDADGVLREVAAVKMTGRNLDRASVGDVIEVKYLYMTNDRRLYGPPVFMGYRDDKAADECTIDQCKLVNKTVRTTVNER